MRAVHARLAPVLLATACSASCHDQAPDPEPTEPLPQAASPVSLRVATFNVSLYRDALGALREELETSDDSPAAFAATILQIVRPDIVLLNEVDFDETGRTVDALRTRFLAVGQDGRTPLEYPHVYVPEVNTGVPSGFDLDGDGRSDHAEGTEGHAGDAFGFGRFPGQYGMVVLSRFPIRGARTFRTTRWADMPDNQLPTDFYGAEAAAVLRLSSKTHADVTVEVDGRDLHLLISHPTPPAFDGPEQRNGRRNHDEIRFWVDHLDGAGWIVDDQGTAGGLASDAHAIVLGDLNSDPHDGGSRSDAIRALLGHPRVTDVAPTSEGAIAAATDASDKAHTGPAATDTADFGPSVGNLRVDHVIPTTTLTVRGSGVFWPTPDDPDFALVGTHPFPLTDHRLVWVDVDVP